MFLLEANITSTWTALDTLVTVGATDELTLINNSSDIIYMVEGDATPAEGIIGAQVEPGNYATYKKGSQAHLYIRNGYVPATGGAAKTSSLLINKVG